MSPVPASPAPDLHSLPTISIPHRSGSIVTTDEPALTHHYHPKPVVYVRVHSGCRTFYGFGQMYNDMYP